MLTLILMTGVIINTLQKLFHFLRWRPPAFCGYWQLSSWVIQCLVSVNPQLNVPFAVYKKSKQLYLYDGVIFQYKVYSEKLMTLTIWPSATLKRNECSNRCGTCQVTYTGTAARNFDHMAKALCGKSYYLKWISGYWNDLQCRCAKWLVPQPNIYTETQLGYNCTCLCQLFMFK